MKNTKLVKTGNSELSSPVFYFSDMIPKFFYQHICIKIVLVSQGSPLIMQRTIFDNRLPGNKEANGAIEATSLLTTDLGSIALMRFKTEFVKSNLTQICLTLSIKKKPSTFSRIPQQLAGEDRVYYLKLMLLPLDHDTYFEEA